MGRILAIAVGVLIVLWLVVGAAAKAARRLEDHNKLRRGHPVRKKVD